MTISEANLVPANNSVAIEDVSNKNNETQITMTKFLFRQKRHKNLCKTNFKKSLKRKKKNSTNSKTLTTKIVSR